METSEERIIEAGVKYQTILDKLKQQRADYSRFTSHVGTLESRILASEMEPAVQLPALPPLKEYTQGIAENLLSLTEFVLYRPLRIPAPLNKDELGSYWLACKGDDQFSPERFAKELTDSVIGNEAKCKLKSRIIQSLQKDLISHLQRGTTPHITAVISFTKDGTRTVDSISSLKIFEMLRSLATVMEIEGLQEDVCGDLDCWLSQVNDSGRACIPKGLEFGKDESLIKLSLRGETLNIRLSKKLEKIVLDYAS